jgi:hypothetical protein
VATVASELTPDQRDVLRRAKALAQRHERISARMGEIEELRTDIYEEGRACDPPLTFQQLATVFKVTTQSVIQKIDRREASRQRQAAS